MKEYRGHSSFVNDAIVSVNGQKIASGSSDGTVRVSILSDHFSHYGVNHGFILRW